MSIKASKQFCRVVSIRLARALHLYEVTQEYKISQTALRALHHAANEPVDP